MFKTIRDGERVSDGYRDNDRYGRSCRITLVLSLAALASLELRLHYS